ncbi:Malate/L-lactate dehydrogenase [Popillia japonica]
MGSLWHGMTMSQHNLMQNPMLKAGIIAIGKRNMAQTAPDTPLIPLAEAKRFISECLQAVGAPKKHADAMGDLLVAADRRGHMSHGMNRLEMFVNDIRSGNCDPKAVPKILKETVATAWVDGQNGLGVVIGDFCMGTAIKKAKEVGIGIAAAKGSNHYGISSRYNFQAVKEGLLGMNFTNTSPFLAPTRSKKAFFGTNPIALAAPGKEGDKFVLDVSTTAVSYGKIEIARRKGIPIPEGWAQDKDGRTTTDTNIAMAPTSCLMPLGGSETNSGYKGYGLAFIVEIFAGILSGATYGPNIKRWLSTERVADLGQCFIAINPKCFAPGFEDRLSDLMNAIR